jgi:predicted Zn-dependent protease
VAAADEGLAKKPDATVRWRLELVRLEALARSGRADAALQAIERLAATEGTPVTASHYLSTADQLRGAGNQAGAIQLLDKGTKRFPDNADITQAIGRAKESGSSEELDTLRSLGYLD